MTRRAAVGVALLASLVLAAVIGPRIAGADPRAIDTEHILAAPSVRHPFGTDDLGADVLARVAAGASPSLGTGILATLIAVTLGVTFGALAGLGRARLDAVLCRIADVVNAFPPLIAAVALVGLAPRAPSLFAAVVRVGVIVGVFAAPALFRFVRIEVRRLCAGDLALAAIATGATPQRVALRHLLPLALGAVVVPASFLAAGAIAVEAGLGFLGIGIPPDSPTWGNILAQGMARRDVAWWLVLFPGAAIFVTVLACHLIGDGLAENGT